MFRFAKGEAGKYEYRLASAKRGTAARIRSGRIASLVCRWLRLQEQGEHLPCRASGELVTRDGNALVVHRFDVDEQGHSLCGMEDFCALLGLRPAAKNETTWERVAWAVRDDVPGSRSARHFADSQQPSCCPSHCETRTAIPRIWRYSIRRGRTGIVRPPTTGTRD